MDPHYKIAFLEHELSTKEDQFDSLLEATDTIVADRALTITPPSALQCDLHNAHVNLYLETQQRIASESSIQDVKSREERIRGRMVEMMAGEEMRRLKAENEVLGRDREVSSEEMRKLKAENEELREQCDKGAERVAALEGMLSSYGQHVQRLRGGLVGR